MTREARGVKTGRFGRLSRMAGAGLGTIGALARGSADGVENAVERLGELRGLGTKVGQMAGLVEANLSDDLRTRVGPALARLRDQTLRSPWPEVRALLEAELGMSIHEAFERFDEEPVASASLGQVHRAVHRGRDVAVKVQHPGIEEAFRADLQNVTGLASVPLPLMMPRDAGKEFIGFVREGFLAELDYEREAANQRVFVELGRDVGGVRVPEVIDERSTARVLTTEWASGIPVSGLMADAEARAGFATSVRDFVLGTLLRHGWLFADAHAGNFLFPERGEGPVVVLDYGSVFRFEPAQRDAFRGLASAAIVDPSGASPAFRDAVSRMVGFEDERAIAIVARIQNAAFGTLVRGDRLEKGHLKRVTENMGELKSALFRARVGLPPFMPFWMRTTLALVALVVALDAPEGRPLVVPR